MKIYVDDQTDINLDDYPTASIPIGPGADLSEPVDRMRKAKGYLPFFDDSGDYWDNGWYDYWIDYDLDKGIVTDLYAVVVGNSNDVPDNMDTYHLDFDPDDLTMQLADLVDLEELRKEAKEYYGEDICN